MISIFPNKKSPVIIDGLDIDTTLTEEHSFNNTITDYPVEKGANITDHVKQLPETLSIDSITSDTPVRFISENFKALTRVDGSNRAQLAFNKILEFAGYSTPRQPGEEPTKINDPILLTVITGLRIYTGMIISKVTFPININTGQSINYQVSFKKIKYVTTKISKIQKAEVKPVVKNKAQKKIDKGNQETKVKSSAVKVTNFLERLFTK
jgi:hypothetical protein